MWTTRIFLYYYSCPLAHSHSWQYFVPKHAQSSWCSHSHLLSLCTCVPWVNTCEVLPLVSSSPGCVAVGQWSSGVSRTLRPWLSVQRTTDVACYLSPSPRGDETPALNWPSQGLPHTCTTFIISNKNDYHKSEIIVAIKYFMVCKYACEMLMIMH